KLHEKLGTAESGASGLDKGIGKLETGAVDLNGGIYKLVDGSGKLAGGLHEGADRIPDYDAQDRDRRTEVMADPVKLVSRDLHKAPNYGTGFAPYFIPLSLWVGAMVAYMLIAPMNRRALAAGASAWRISLGGWVPVVTIGVPAMGGLMASVHWEIGRRMAWVGAMVAYMLIAPMNRRALAAGASAWRIALAGWLPVVAIGVLQTVALMAVLHWAIGLQMARAAGTVGFLFLASACFAAIVQWLNARFGAAGRILVLALLMLQLTSAGGTYPVQTSPGFFEALHP